MTEAHIKEATKMLGWFFDRCGKVPHYKGNIENDGIIIDGKKIPPCPMPMNNCTIIDNHVFIDGYEWKNSKWKKTLRALYHKYF